MLHAIALYDCVADDEGELTFSEGTRFVDVVDSNEGGWLEGRIEGTSQRGLFPNNYVDVFTVPSSSSSSSPPPPPPSSSSSSVAAKPIPKVSNSEASQSNSVSPPSSSISSSWSVIPNAPATTAISSNTNSNAKLDNNNQSKSGQVDAFDAAMYTTPSSKYSDITSTIMNKRTVSRSNMTPTTFATTLETVKPSTNYSNTHSSPKLSEKKNDLVFPTLRPVQQHSPYTRIRSFSASSSTLSPVQSPLDLNDSANTTVKPSFIRQETSKFQSDSSWRQQPGSAFPTLRQTPVGNNNNKTETNNDEDDIEEEDGYQLIKPSQIRKRQVYQDNKGNHVNKSPTIPITTLSSSSSSRKPSSTASTRLDALPSTNTLARLPSRPVSTANRRSKSKSSFSPSSTSSNTNDPVIVNKPAPTLKPKPAQLNNISKPSVDSTSKPIITTKERSASNPPPIQPKTFMNEVYRPKKPNLDTKPALQIPVRPAVILSKPINHMDNTMATATSSSSSSSPSSSSTSAVIGRKGTAGGVALPGLGKKASAPTLPARPPAVNSLSSATTETLSTMGSTKDDDTNLKPSQLLMQRARSSTNPGFTTRPMIDISTTTNTSKTTKTSTRSCEGTPTDGAIRSPPPPPSLSTPIVKQTPPPPPPPSRIYNHHGNHVGGSRRRYDELFDLIQDDGYVDGMTTRTIWSKSRLSNDILAEIWQHCDQQKSGLLDRQRFIDGMTRIDAYLMKNTLASSATTSPQTTPS
ncbi:uncharacterized protein BX664DRAFT_320078 [Halteromyces radiatus]|uniref:uncharacterized protein n=1 Tax=Halteromyces radiatus TaxID=101107 RepID=UPI00221FA78A|nr:uncharacterized protein BX664DRAFT_320078 [Halteromyces radiatus]KAI8098976.1 hypothetical protein BX664DRAFT_320078 [Halteromyces radiatus]